MKQVKYQWHWRGLSLWREEKETRDGVIIGGSFRVFTLNPRWLWRDFRDWFMWKIGVWPNPNMCAHYEAFEKQWMREHPNDDFGRTLDRYGASCDAGHLICLNPKRLLV